MKAKALPVGVLLKHLMMLTLASLLPSSDHGLNCQEACCSEKEKRGMRVFSFPFLRTKKIKRTVSRPEHSWSEVKWKSLSRVQLFATLWIIVHGILQSRILEWVVFSFSRGSSQPRDQEDPLEKGMATYPSILKATFLFPPNSVFVLFIRLRWAEKAKDLASKSVITIGAVIAEPLSKCPYAEMGRKRI